MKRILALLAVLVATVAFTTGASARDSQIGPAATTCTIYQPQSGWACSQLSQYVYGWTYLYYVTTSVTPWAESQSFARRYQHGYSVWGPCLPGNAQVQVRFMKTNGQFSPVETFPSSCGGSMPVPAAFAGYNNTYTKAQVRLRSTDGGQVYAYLGAFSYWD
jgi:hypothetical protein